MDNNIRKFAIAGMTCAAVCAAALAAPHGERHSAGPRHAASVRHQIGTRGGGPRHPAPAPKAHRPAPPPKMHHAMHGRPGSGPFQVRHAPPPPPPRHHAPCGFRYPRGHHIGGRHVVIVPPRVLINSYYWTEEVFINGQYFLLYCYPDGTKRFADGTIYRYI